MFLLFAFYVVHIYYKWRLSSKRGMKTGRGCVALSRSRISILGNKSVVLRCLSVMITENFFGAFENCWLTLLRFFSFLVLNTFFLSVPYHSFFL